MTMKKLTIATVGLIAALVTVQPAAAAETNTKNSKSTWINPFATFAASPNSYYGDVGAVMALDFNNPDLNKDGFLLRANSFVGHYSYKYLTGAVTRTKDVTYKGGSIMPGYHKFFANGEGLISAYAGVEIQDHPNNDTNAKIRGTKVGAKFQGEVLFPVSSMIYAVGNASYSTAWNSYYAMAKAGYRVMPGMSFGPEFAALGNDRFSAVRFGGFGSFEVIHNIELIGSVGYNIDTHKDPVGEDSGVYGTVHVRWPY
jgi:Cellulose biosynthesis protein BcsS